ncbi:MAG TPA: hypothetical protein VFB58_15975 [Chloroflexota bacterium]|nr:hypothetical protein [Chloroflexota bacterium]
MRGSPKERRNDYLPHPPTHLKESAGEPGLHRLWQCQSIPDGIGLEVSPFRWTYAVLGQDLIDDADP